MNSVCLVGRLTKDPELRKTVNGISTCRFTIAVDGKLDANKEVHTDFINIVVWRNLADTVAEYCKKGDLIGIIGRISTSSYQTQDGSTRYNTDVVADNVRFLSSKKATQETTQNATQVQTSGNGLSSIKSNEIVLSDDDLPF